MERFPRARAGAIACALVFAGCLRLGGGFIESPPGHTRAGVLELRWHRPMVVETVFGEHRPVYRGSPAYDPTRDVVYAGSNDNALFAIRGWDGAVVWRFEALGRVDSTPHPDGDDVLFGAADGAMYCINASTGALQWRFATSAEVLHEPIVIGDSVYFVNSNDAVFAVARRDGSVRWRYRRNAPGGITASGHAGLASFGRRIYAAFSDGTVACLDASDGSVLWSQDTARELDDLDTSNPGHAAIDVDTTPVVIDDMVYVASYTAGVFALDAVGGGQRWRLGDLRGVSGLGSDGRYLYAASSQAGLVKIDPLDGTIVWRREAGNLAAIGAVAIGDGLLAVPSADQAMYVVRTDSGEVLDGVRPGRGFNGLPTRVGSRLFAESNGGTLYAFALRPERSAPAPTR